jgi:hypothetical protein
LPEGDEAPPTTLVVGDLCPAAYLESDARRDQSRSATSTICPTRVVLCG